MSSPSLAQEGAVLSQYKKCWILHNKSSNQCLELCWNPTVTKYWLLHCLTAVPTGYAIQSPDKNFSIGGFWKSLDLFQFPHFPHLLSEHGSNGMILFYRRSWLQLKKEFVRQSQNQKLKEQYRKECEETSVQTMFYGTEMSTDLSMLTSKPRPVSRPNLYLKKW